MQAVLHVLAQAGSQANDRGTVVKDFMKLSYSRSVLGSYTITDGDTNFNRIVIERLKGAQLVTVRALQG